LLILVLAILIGFSASHAIAFTIPQSLVGATLKLTDDISTQFFVFTSAHYGYWVHSNGFQEGILYGYVVQEETKANISYSYNYDPRDMSWDNEADIYLTFINSTSGYYTFTFESHFGWVTTTGTFQLSEPNPPPDPPNLTPYTPAGWSDKIVVSKTTGTNTDSSPLLSTDTLYIDWAIINNGESSI